MKFFNATFEGVNETIMQYHMLFGPMMFYFMFFFF